MLAEVNGVVSELVVRALAAGEVPIVLGGDHSLIAAVPRRGALIVIPLNFLLQDGILVRMLAVEPGSPCTTAIFKRNGPLLKPRVPNPTVGPPRR